MSKSVCKSCCFWATYGNGTGECIAIDVEPRTKFIIRKKETDPLVWAPLEGAEKENFRASMLTPWDFSCSDWQENKNRERPGD